MIMKKLTLLSLTGVLTLVSLTGCVKVDNTQSSTSTTASTEIAETDSAFSEADSETTTTASATESATEAKKTGGQVVVYNWGEYMDPEVLDIFEEETGIKVIYEEFETNEIMYPKVAAGAIAYDVVCPSDYMIQKMIENDLLQELNYDNLPNIKNIDEEYMSWSEEFDPGNK